MGLGAVALMGAGGGLWWWKQGVHSAPKVAAPAPGLVGSAAAKLAQNRGACPAGMVFVPAGTFTMGSPDGEGKDDERPAHPVKLQGYCLGGTEVTVASYRDCVHEKRGELQCTPPRPQPSCNWTNPARGQHPINCVDWTQADTYCKWAGGALPTEAQWEYAARGADGRKYPWGSEPPRNNRLNACGPECAGSHENRQTMYDKPDKFVETAPVGSFPDGAGPFGALDLAGNVFEWVADWYAPYAASATPAQDPTGPATGGDKPVHVLRGATYYSGDPLMARGAARFPALGSGSPTAGFRCVQKP